MTPVAESNTLAELIKAARGDMPMRELARRSDLSAAQISRIEGGTVESPTIETLTSLARGLGRDPQLLLAALGRLDDEGTAGFVLRSLPDSGSPSETPAFAAARVAVEQTHHEVTALDATRKSLLHDWQVLGAKHDELKAEATEIETEAGALLDSEPYVDDPRRMAAQRKDAEKRLKSVQRQLDELNRRGAELRREMKKCEAAMNEAIARRSEAVRVAAGGLFVSGVTSRERELEALLAGTIDMPAGTGKSHLLAQLVASTSAAQRESLDRAVAEILESTARLEVDEQALRKHLAETLTESFAKTRAELEQATRQLRKQLVYGAGDADFRRLSAAWNRLTPERRKKVLDFIDDQRRLSMQEQLEQERLDDGEREEVVTIERPSSRSPRS